MAFVLTLLGEVPTGAQVFPLFFLQENTYVTRQDYFICLFLSLSQSIGKTYFRTSVVNGCSVPQVECHQAS